MHSILALATLFLILTMTACGEHTHPLANHDHHHDHHHTHDLTEHHHQNQHDTELKALHEKLIGPYNLRTVQTTLVKHSERDTLIEQQPTERVSDTIRLTISTNKFEIRPEGQWPWPAWAVTREPILHVRGTIHAHYYSITPKYIQFHPTEAISHIYRDETDNIPDIRYKPVNWWDNHYTPAAIWQNYGVTYTWDDDDSLILTHIHLEREDDNWAYRLTITKWQKVT